MATKCAKITGHHNSPNLRSQLQTQGLKISFKMKAIVPIRIAAFALATFLCALPPRANAQNQPQSPPPDQTPLNAQQLDELISRTIQNQHRNDAAADSFERIEREISHSGRADGPVTQDKTYRVVPTGSGTLKLLLRDKSKTVSDAVYRHQLGDWEDILKVAVHADDPRQVAVLAKQQKKRKDRARFVDAATVAYKITWLDREIRDGRVVEKLQFAPNPAYKPRGDSTDWLTHAQAIVWVDTQDAQVAVIDASITRDISIGAGFLGKIYHGSHFLMQQAPATPGIWEPSHYEYDISGRKFLFGFTLHEEISDSRYQLLGSPEELLARAQDNLAHCCDINALTMETTLHTGGESH